MKHQAQNPTDKRGFSLLHILPLMLGISCHAPRAVAADITVPDGGALPALSALDPSGPNTITLSGSVALVSEWSPNNIPFSIIAGGSGPSTIAGTGSANALMISLQNSGTWRFDNIILTGGTASTLSGAALHYSGNDGGTMYIDGDIQFRNNYGRFGGAFGSEGPGAPSNMSIVFGGNLIFEDNSAYRSGAVYYADAGTITFKGTTQFINNTSANGQAGAVTASNTNSKIIFEAPVVFSKNYSSHHGGGLYILGDAVFMDSATFTMNTSATMGGAIYMQTLNKSMYMEKNVIAISNTAGLRNTGSVVATNGAGGAFALQGDWYIGGSSTFSNNTAHGTGGAIYWADNSAAVTRSGTLNATAGDITFKGNMAMAATTSTPNAIHINSALAAGTERRLYLNTGSGANAHTISFYDPITALANATVRIIQDGDGTLLFDTRNTALVADTLINSGTFRLTRGATYGGNTTSGTITLKSPATISGNGVLLANRIAIDPGSTLEVLGGGTLTLSHGSPLVGATGLTLLGSGTIDAGGALSAAVISVGTLVSANPEMPDATVNSTQKLAFAASTPVTLANGGVIHIDLFGSGSSDLLNANTLTIAGSGTINFNSTITGTYKIITTTNDISSAGLVSTINGNAVPNRYSANLDYKLAGTETWLELAVINFGQTWTGAAGSIWKNSETTDANWTDAGATELFFFDGDRVTFGDTGAGTVTIDAAGVTVADMTVNVTADYAFAGAGGITADTVSSSGLSTPATGKLVKTGAGTLTFANTGGNTFSGGIEIDAGAIAFTRADQLGDGGNGITFSNSSTLRAGTGTISLGNNLIIQNGAATAVVDVVTGGTLTHTGLIQATAGMFVKSNGGVFIHAADSSTSFAASARVDGGSFLLASGAKLGGSVLVSSGGIFGGSGSASSITTLTGGILQVGMPGTAGTLHAGTLDLAAGTTLDFTLLVGNQSSALQTAATPTLAAGSITSNYTINISDWVAGSYTLGNIGALDTATFTLKGSLLNPRQSYTASDAAGVLQITIQPTASAVLVWGGSNAAGVDNGRWNSSAENWSAAGIPFADYDATIFNDTVFDSVYRNVEIMNDMVVSDMTVTGTGDYRFTGAGAITGNASGAVGIGGNEKLTKTGAGTLTFANTGGNLFTGGIDIGGIGTEGGLIAFDRADQLAVGAAAAITFQSAGTLRALADIPAAGALASAIVVDNGVNATFDTGVFEVAYSGSLSVAGAGATLTKTGIGALRITGTSDSANLALNVTQGSLLLDGGSLGTAVNLRSGALLAGSGAAAAVSVDAGATLSVGDGALHIAALQLADSSTLAGRGTLSGAAAISGNVTALIAGSNELTLSAATSGAGTLIKTGSGTLVYSNASALGHAATSIDAGVVMLRSFTSFPASSGLHTFVLNGGWLDLSEGGIYDPTGATANDWSGLNLIGDSGRVIGTNDCITLRAGSVGFDIGSSTKQGLFVVVDTGPGGVAKMTGVNNYAGYTLLKSGALQVTADNQLGLIDNALYREVVFDGGKLAIESDGFTSGRAIELRAGGGTISVPLAATATWSGVISGPGTFAKDGAGTLVLKGEPTHSGGIVITAGTLQGNTTSLRGNITNHGHLVFDQSFNDDFAGSIAGTGVVTKIGEGWLLLSGALSTATLNLDAGTLVVPGGKTLGTTQFNNNAILRIGKAGGNATHGTVTIAGNYTGSDGKLFLGLDLSGTTMVYDRLHVAGNAAGNTTVDFGSLIIPDSLSDGILPNDIISWDGTASRGTFTQSDNSVIEFGGLKYTWEINDNGSAGRWLADPIATAPAMLGADAAALLVNKAAIASLSQRMQFERFGNRGHLLELWANGMHRHDKITDTAYDGMKANTQGVQVGADWAATKDGNNFMAIGAFYDYAKSDLHLSGKAADLLAESNGGGIYYTERKGHWFTNLILRYSNGDYYVSVPGRPSFKTKGQSYGFSAEAGRTFVTALGDPVEGHDARADKGRVVKLRKSLMFQPQLQLTGQRIETDDTTDPYGRHYRIYNTDSIEARAGALLSQDFQFTGRQQQSLSLYARTSLAYDFDGKSELHVADSTYKNDIGGGSVMLNAGVSVRFTRWISAGLDAACYYGRQAEGYSINLGVTCMW
ncbi:autotransporter-associated beta strand repeat-containing protein [Termitidicoccus mucosus]|uniref:Autotransporter domain-containing protein n=1 Tax=Termitidicoccus mucosus TaxID=1184151 RepID=A0A178IHK5_9BACT|nr:hypothetical protein AW736_17025 [Opitutaceae bacterium TSB47]